MDTWIHYDNRTDNLPGGSIQFLNQPPGDWEVYQGMHVPEKDQVILVYIKRRKCKDQTYTSLQLFIYCYTYILNTLLCF